MTPGQSTMTALALAGVILGVGVAPKILTETPASPEVCDEVTAGRGELDGKPAMVFHLCGSPFMLVGPIGTSAIPPVIIDDAPQFTEPAPAIVPGEESPTVLGERHARPL